MLCDAMIVNWIVHVNASLHICWRLLNYCSNNIMNRYIFKQNGHHTCVSIMFRTIGDMYHHLKLDDFIAQQTQKQYGV